MSRDVARVYIGDLGSGGSKPELEREFERYGPLKSVWVARNPPGMKNFS
jgi:RNA recognition motif-containing protein